MKNMAFWVIAPCHLEKEGWALLNIHGNTIQKTILFKFWFEDKCLEIKYY
jgi:hypothetical protein